MGHLVFDQDKCAGCRNCEIVCSLNKWGVMNTELSCIQIDTDILGGYISEARTCKQCLGPECVAACPTGALSIDPDTGARVIDRDVCIGCQSCLNACPAVPSNVRYNPTAGVCVKCDLCGGDPQCVQYCSGGALSVSWAEEEVDPTVPSNVRYNPTAGVCVKCDLCGGDPQCVQYCSGGALSVSWAEEEVDPTMHETPTGIPVKADLSGAILVVAPTSVTLDSVDTAVDGNRVSVFGSVTNGYTQPFTCKIKVSYFDDQNEVLWFAERLEIEAEVGATIEFEDSYEGDCVQYCSGGALSVSWAEEEVDPTMHETPTGIPVKADLSGAILVVAPTSVTLDSVDTAVDGNRVSVFGSVTNGYTQPFTCKIKVSYFDDQNEVLWFAERLEIEAEVGATIEFEDSYEGDVEKVALIRLEIMCGKISG